jgi:hypothetical protein
MHGTTAAFLLIAGLALAGCRAEADERAALIAAGIEDCVRSLDSSSAERPGLMPAAYESRRICTCSWERVGRDRNIDQLRAMSRGGEPPAALVEAAGSCLVEEGQRTGLLTK